MSDLPEYIGEELLPGQLDRLTTRLSNEVARLTKITARYEIDLKATEKAYSVSKGKATILYKEQGVITIVKLMIEQDKDVIAAADKLQEAEALYIMAKAELEGRIAQYQAAKRLVDLKIQELRTFRG